MLHLHATKKVLNIGKLKPEFFISKAEKGQHLHDWYVSLGGSGFAGKFLILYVHQPSLLTIVVKGRTIKTTYAAFLEQLEGLLKRFYFPQDFIKNESALFESYAVGKTTSRSMLAHINQIIPLVSYHCEDLANYDEIDVTDIENLIMRNLYYDKEQKGYTNSITHWKERLDFKKD